MERNSPESLAAGSNISIAAAAGCGCRRLEQGWQRQLHFESGQPAHNALELQMGCIPEHPIIMTVDYFWKMNSIQHFLGHIRPEHWLDSISWCSVLSIVIRHRNKAARLSEVFHIFRLIRQTHVSFLSPAPAWRTKNVALPPSWLRPYLMRRSKRRR